MINDLNNTTENNCPQETSFDQVRNSLPRDAKVLNTELAEFTIHALIRLWDQKGIAPQVDAMTFGNWKQGDVLSPAGYEDVFPDLVKEFMTLLQRTEICLSIILCALLYVFRARQSIQGNVCNATRYQVFMIALILAQKMHYDQRYSNLAWSKVIPYTVKDITKMERQFLAQLQNNLFIKKEHYDMWLGTMQTLGKERNIVKAALTMPPDERYLLYSSLAERPDLISEIHWVIRNRKSRNHGKFKIWRIKAV
ncbi:hypothetical protein HDV06_001996 [Boothiomyces sp. JEL0866]|nr:hypothetical protein HDV06_001996 [Boothiomyces sp. JEL0866]